MENKKNTILLTVIAVATLLVAVVGATFAFFSAQNATRTPRAVTVTTSTTNTGAFKIKNDIEVTANEVTFAKDEGDRTGSTTATAEFTASNEADVSKDFCYSVSLEITTNTFEYTVDEDTAELVFTAKKGASGAAASAEAGEVLIEKDITTATETIKVPTAKNGSDYKHVITGVPGTQVIDNYYFEVAFKNLDTDQNDNAGNSFAGSIVFDVVDCD